MLFRQINGFFCAQWLERSFIYLTQRTVFWKRSWPVDKHRSNFWEEWIIVRKITATYWDEWIIGRKFAVNHRTKRIIIRKITRIKTLGVTQMQGNFIEMSFQAKFLWKDRNFVEIRLHYFCTILYMIAPCLTPHEYWWFFPCSLVISHLSHLSFVQQVSRKCFDLWQYTNIKAFFFEV